MAMYIPFTTLQVCCVVVSKCVGHGNGALTMHTPVSLSAIIDLCMCRAKQCQRAGELKMCAVTTVLSRQLSWRVSSHIENGVLMRKVKGRPIHAQCPDGSLSNRMHEITTVGPPRNRA